MNYNLSIKSRTILPIVACTLAMILAATPSTAFDTVNKTSSGVAIKGYDAVAYHTENRALKGRSEFSYNWNDAVWYFTSVENKDLFASAPERYAPQYGGY